MKDITLITGMNSKTLAVIQFIEIIGTDTEMNNDEHIF